MLAGCRLTRLKLSYNNLINVPAELGFLKNLQELQLTHNQLTVSSFFLNRPGSDSSKWQHFRMLSIHRRGRRLTIGTEGLQMLPAALGAILPPEGSLTQLGLSANYFKAPLSQIVLRGTPATLRFLREQI
jgi:Leucine-rich repeat (LRR) protein